MNETIEKIAILMCNRTPKATSCKECALENVCDKLPRAKAIYTEIVEPLEREIEELEKEIDLEVDLQAKRKRQIIYESQEFIDELAHKAKVLEQEKDLYKKSAIEMNDKFLQAMKRVEVLERALELACEHMQLCECCDYADEDKCNDKPCAENQKEYCIRQAEKEITNETI